MSRSSLVIATVLLAACSGKRVDQPPAKADAKVAPPEAGAPAAAAPDAKAPPTAPLAVQNSDGPPAGTAPESPPTKPAGPLTPEEQRLIDSDPKDLTPDERRARAYALRKKIMQNPDSPTARALEDLRKAAERGEIAPPDFGKGNEEKKEGVWLDAKGNQVGGPPPAGARPD